MTILVIEDDDRVASFLKRGLEAEGYGVRVARDGVSGLAAAIAKTARVIILDWKLPDAEGISVCRDLRANGVATPILILTARDGLDDKIEGLRVGADDYVTKPFAFDELLARIAALMRRAPAIEIRPARLEIDDLSFDRDSLQVRRGARGIHLTSKELAILDLLMSNAGRVFSRERILSAVWGADADPAANIVDVYIGKLRRKIDSGGETPLLHTIRGRGFRIATAHAADNASVAR